MKRKLFWILSVAMLLSFAGCGDETVEDDVEVVGGEETVHEESYVLENDDLKLVLDGETTQFSLEQKDSGYIWYSNPEEAQDDPLANGENKSQLLSTLVVQYTTSDSNKILMNNYDYSISKKTFLIEQTDDALCVTYTIGDIEKEYYIPHAAPASRMEEFLEKMEKSEVKQVNNIYRKYDINKLRATDNKAELLEKYPDLENEIVYVMRDNAQEYLKEKVEAIFENAGYTREDYQEDMERYNIEKVNEKPAFNVTLEYRLDGDELVVSAPMEKMNWKSDYPMTKLSVLPYMGAGGTEDEGYMFVPDGSGGIINFNNGKTKQSAFYANVYGWDYAVKRDALISETSTVYPVFGIKNNNESMICVLEDNCSIATIEADISGKTCSYNNVYASYQPVHGESMDVSSKSDKAVMMFESEKPEGSLSQRYIFGVGDDYVDMAIAYREYLQDRYPDLTKSEEADGTVQIEILGAIDKQEQVLGVPTQVSKPLTTFKEAQEVLKELQEAGFERMNLTYTGWLDGGVTHTIPKDADPDSVLGSKKNLKAFAAAAKEAGATLFLDGAVENAYGSNLFDGFIKNRDAAKHVTREVVELKDFSYVWYGQNESDDYYYLLKPQVSVSLMKTLAEAAQNYGSTGVSFTDIGNLLSADYNPKNYTSRQSVLKLQQETLAGIKESGTLVSLKGGNDYVLPYVDQITNMQLGGNDYLIIDEEIPFYQIAIHGLVEYAGTSVNLSSDVNKTVLESAKTGANLSFSFMYEDISILQESNYRQYYGAQFDLWKDKAQAIYERYYDEMSGLANQYIIGYEQIFDGLTVTEYEDGTKVYVNETNYDQTVYDVTVGAKDYYVEKGGK